MKEDTDKTNSKEYAIKKNDLIKLIRFCKEEILKNSNKINK